MEFSLHTYIQGLRTGGAPDAFIRVVRQRATPLANARLPVILTLGQLAYCTDVPYGLLTRIIGRQSDPYRVFAIRKRAGGKRYICAPESHLLSVQRWIHQNILLSPYARAKLSNSATAYVPDSSHIANAKRHLGAEWLLKLDITNFFESISERQVFRIFRDLHYPPLVAFGLTRLCTRVLPPDSDQRFRRRLKRWQTGRSWRFLSTRVVGHLPQGAPTSPMLANLACRSLDVEMLKIAASAGLTYTRYADDMTFSGDTLARAEAAQLVRELSEVVATHGFRVNSQKISIAGSGSRRIVTGLSVAETDGVRLPRVYKDKLRQELHMLAKYGVESHCERLSQKNHFAYLCRLAGQIRYAASIEPALGAKLTFKFEELFPDFDKLEALVRERPADAASTSSRVS